MKYLLAMASLVLFGCDFSEPRAEPPKWTWENALPADCATLVQQGVDAYRDKRATADFVMDGLEKHCGAKGTLAWK